MVHHGRRPRHGRRHREGDARRWQCRRRHRPQVRAYIEELLPDVLEGRIEPGRVFDRIGSLDEVPDGYRAMNEREALKVLIQF